MRNLEEEKQVRSNQFLEDLQRQPHLFIKLAENALTVAESLRDNYLKNTTSFVSALRLKMDASAKGAISDPILTTHEVGDIGWEDVKGEVVTFIDGGIGQVKISSRVPLLLRVGSYCVKTGERQLAQREQFGYYPVIFGDLEGGSKDRKDFVDIVRITAELLGGLSALVRTPNLSVLMFHGPLVYKVGNYAGHTPFTERDIDLFLQHYAVTIEYGEKLKEEFLEEARLDIYPQIAPDRCLEWSRLRVFEPLAWMSFLFRRLINEAKAHPQKPIIVGVVERSDAKEYLLDVLLKQVFRHLRRINNPQYFNKIFGRTDLTSEKAIVERLGYTDAFLLALLLRPGQFADPWEMNKFEGLHKGEISLPGESFITRADWGCLRPSNKIGFPRVIGSYLHVSERTEPVRIEVFNDLGPEQLTEAAKRTYLYSRLLPGYGFPVGLDVADKHSHVPAWLTEAYGKLIRYQLGVSLQRGEITDTEMRRILVQAIYVTHRDWLFRPKV